MKQTRSKTRKLGQRIHKDEEPSSLVSRQNWQQNETSSAMEMFIAYFKVSMVISLSSSSWVFGMVSYKANFVMKDKDEDSP